MFLKWDLASAVSWFIVGLYFTAVLFYSRMSSNPSWIFPLLLLVFSIILVFCLRLKIKSLYKGKIISWSGYLDRDFDEFPIQIGDVLKLLELRKPDSQMMVMDKNIHIPFNIAYNCIFRGKNMVVELSGADFRIEDIEKFAEVGDLNEFIEHMGDVINSQKFSLVNAIIRELELSRRECPKLQEDYEFFKSTQGQVVAKFFKRFCRGLEYSCRCYGEIRPA